MAYARILTVGLSEHHDRFFTRFTTLVSEAQSGDAALCMALFDMDLFGKLNDAHGRDGGDAIIAWFAERLAGAVGDKGEVLRYGGDAFAIVFPGIEKEEAFLLSESARRAVDGEAIVYSGDQAVKFSLTASAGLASFPDDGATAVEVVRKANEALYRAKAGGRNRVCLAREERMVTKTSHYTQGQLAGLARLAKRMGVGEAVLLREALDDVLRKYNQ
ncbi:MAG: diguanylate cyclase [Candidatus Hydrogenedentes bacterium]|nr:diguanylate cyclase [Candidatus Hydrogenedentota bacterium]